MKNKRLIILFSLFLLFTVTERNVAPAKTFAPPDDPTQYITYWKPHTLSAENDPLAAEAQGVFSVLLRAWDRSGLEPKLFVVNSAAGPWAASLADGNILISRAAIEICFDFGAGRAEHLLAFVLAHELAHQRSDDLWHQRFFRLIGNQSPEVKQKILNEFELGDAMWKDVAQKEAQADHDGLIMMASVGYDPYQILDKQDFFTRWVENIWGSACDLNPSGSAVGRACQAAQSRALRARAQLTTVATQAMLYELGVQAFIASDYEKARRYFRAYGRDYSNRALLTALGLSHFAEALVEQQWLIKNQALERPAFYYPLLLDANPILKPEQNQDIDTAKRSALSVLIEQKKIKMQSSLEKSIAYFEKAIRLEPQHAKTYLLLAFSYLLDGNSFMARGIIQGKYQPQFAKDPSSALILAMISAIEGKKKEATKDFETLIGQLRKPLAETVFPADVLIYTAYYNSAAYASFIGKNESADLRWKKLARESQSSGNSYLFRLALTHLSSKAKFAAPLKNAPTIAGLRLGDHFPKSLSPVSGQQGNALWIEGEQFQVLRLEEGSRYVVGADQEIISAWQDAGTARLNDRIAVGDAADRPLKTLGIPDRRLHFMSGDYLAYDDYGLAIHIVYNKVAGWFLYQTK